jgi:hypothetical protein
MKCMKVLNLLLLGTLFLGLTAEASDAVPVYEQSYTILIKGSIAGSEKVTETINEAGSILSASDHEIFVTDTLGVKRMTFATKMQLAKSTYTPISYSYKYTSGDAGDFYDVAVKGAQIKRTLSRKGHISEVTVPFQTNTVILDFNVYHQYDYVVRQYDGNKGGRQVFSDFVPLIGNDISFALTSLGSGELNSANGSMTVSNYRVEFVGVATGILSVDKNKRLVRLLIPTQDLEVVRADLLPAGNKN